MEVNEMFFSSLLSLTTQLNKTSVVFYLLFVI